MRVTPFLAILSATALVLGCEPENPTSLSQSDVPQLSSSAGESWVITTYYWDDGWVRHHAWNASYLPPDLRFGFNAHNWEKQFPEVLARFDDVYLYGDVDLPEGLVDDFNDGVIGSVWDWAAGEQCVYGRGGTACEGGGVVTADVEEGSDGGLYHFAGLNTGVVIHGEFDLRIDFSVDQAFHDAPNGKTNAILCVWNESWSESACIEIDSGFYDSHGGSPGHLVKRVFSNDLQGKLRITRTRVHKGRVEESVSGSGSRVVTEQEGDWRTFSFTARRHADGTVNGQWERIRREDGNAADSKSRGIVTCFTIVGDEAWLGGIATHGLFSGSGVAWRVKDNPDQISLQWTDVGLGYPAWHCANMPDDPELHDIEAGNIQVKR